MTVDLLRILTQHHVDIDTTVNRGWVNVRCPMPSCTDTGKHGGFNLAGGYYHCWKCGSHSLSVVLRKLLRMPGDQVDALIDENQGRLSALAVLNKKTAAATKIEWPGKPLNAGEKKYLRGRGFDPKFLAEYYGIAGGGIGGDWRYRILVPIYQDGKLMSFLGRDITGESNMRYKNLQVEKSVRDPKACLYNLDHCTGDHVHVLEGVTDVWRMGDGFVATLGTTVTAGQTKLLSQRFRKVTFLFDPEPEAQGKARKVGAQLSALGVDVELVDLELPYDPGDLSPEEAYDIRKELGV